MASSELPMDFPTHSLHNTTPLVSREIIVTIVSIYLWFSCIHTPGMLHSLVVHRQEYAQSLRAPLNAKQPLSLTQSRVTIVLFFQSIHHRRDTHPDSCNDPDNIDHYFRTQIRKRMQLNPHILNTLRISIHPRVP